MPRYPEEVEDVSAEEIDELFPTAPKVERREADYCACGARWDSCPMFKINPTRHFRVTVTETLTTHGQLQTA